MQGTPAARPSASDWVPGDGIPWVCPECWFILGQSTIPQSEALRKLHEHIANGHRRDDEGSIEDEQDIDSDFSTEESVGNDQLDLSDRLGNSGKRLVPCRYCPNPVREDRLADHLSRVHHIQHPPVQPKTAIPQPGPEAPAPTGRVIPPEIPVERFSFELLPPGTWEIDDVLRHYREQARTRPEIFGGRAIDYGRIEKMKSLRPIKCYIGRELWEGYVVFEFKGIKRVVLDCPVEGNAIYLLSGDWKRMVGRSKKHLRTEFRDNCTKIVHKGDWLDRVRYALY